MKNYEINYLSLNDKRKFIEDKINLYLKENNFEYDEGLHKYVINNEKFDSVTSIVGTLNFGKFDSIPQQVLINKARIGSMTHYWLELMYKGENADEWFAEQDELYLWDDSYRKQVNGYINAARLWWQENNETIIGSEIALIDIVNKIAGRTDLLQFIDNEWYVSDYKTSAKIDLKRQPMQIYCYAAMLNNIIGEELFTKGRLIQLKKDGSYQEYTFDLKEYSRNWKLCLANFLENIRD